MAGPDTITPRPEWLSDPQHRELPRAFRWLASSLLLLASLAGAPLAAQQPATEGRASLLDLAARAEVDGYARLDEMTERSAALPNVFDPAELLSTDAESLRDQLQKHSVWLESARAAHLYRVETLPADMRAISTSEPYKEELASEIASLTPERVRLVSACYQGELEAVNAQLAFLGFIEKSDVRIGGDGFTFTTDEDVIEYTGHVAAVNAAFEAQNQRMERYYAWELRQKARLGRYRDRL